MILWRVSNQITLSGDGALRASGRWHTRGRRIVYCAQTPAAALLEILVHHEINVRDLPARYRLLRITAPDDISIETLAVDELPPDWAERTALTRAIGDAWLTQSRSPVLIVPSAIVPETSNVLLNPSHEDARRVRVDRISEHAIDRRLLE